MTTHERRTALVGWLYRQAGGAPYTTAQIVAESNIYVGHGRWDTAHRDLCRLKGNGVVRSVPGHSPARWELVA